MKNSEVPVRERILQTATNLFSELGYDQTNSQMIADATGIPVSSITEEFGSKSELYLAVLQVIQELEEEVLNEIVIGYTPDREGLHHLIDKFFDYYLENPQAAALWTQRMMSDAADFKEIEKRHAFPQINAGRNLVQGAFREDLDTELAIWMLMWSVRSFVRGGVLDEHGHRIGREDPRTVNRFRRHLHKVVDLFSRYPDRTA